MKTQWSMNEYRYPFEKLNVWPKCRALAVLTYNLTQTFPVDERYGLVSQMRRASISIISNIAEGTSRITKREQARFTEIAYASATELLAQSIISFDLGYLAEQNYQEFRQQLQEVTAMLAALRKTQTDELHEPDVYYTPNPD